MPLGEGASLGRGEGAAPAREVLQAQLLRQAAHVFKSGRTSAKQAAGSSAQAPDPSSSSSAVAKLACVQGLKAFVMSSPYDCPGWMPQVLMALVAAAGDSSAQVRSEVSKVLGEFKCTQEQDSLAAQRAVLSSDQWDALQQVSSQAT